LPGKPRPKSEHKKNIAENIKKIVEPAAAFTLQEFRARDLAIATVQNAEGLEERQPPDKRPVSAVPKNERGDDWNRKDQPGPGIRSGVEPQD